MDRETQIAKLATDIRRKVVVTIAGTGVSVAASGNQEIEGFPVGTWPGLLMHGVKHCKDIGEADDSDASLLTDQIRSGKLDFLIMAAETISERMRRKGPGVFRGWLKETVGRLTVKDPAILKELDRLPGVLATLNYDNLLESATERQPVTWLQADGVQDVLAGQRTDAILHLHGSFKEPDSVVLGLRSYLAVKDHPHARAVLNLLTIDRTLLFVGCGDTVMDPNFMRLIEWGREALPDVTPRHFLLCRTSEISDFQTKLRGAPWLQPLDYGDDYKDLVPFLRRLAPTAVVHGPTEGETVAPGPSGQSTDVELAKEDLGRTRRRRVPRELPTAATCFVGRGIQRQQLTDRLLAAKNTAVFGPAGLGKTALAAEAVAAVVGPSRDTLAASPFPDGVVFLDLYTFHGQAEAAWNVLANKLAGAEFLEGKNARDRATEACRSQSMLVIIEGGEEADGQEGRTRISDLLSVLSPDNRWLLLTRDSTQVLASDAITVTSALSADDASGLFDALTGERVTGAVRGRVLELLEGHPLALTWAGNLLARDDEDPAKLVDEWEGQALPALSDPIQAEHTLAWIFRRSVRGLDEPARRVLAAAALLARAPFPLAAVEAALEAPARDGLRRLVQRGLLRRDGTDTDCWQFTHVLGYRFARNETGADVRMRLRLSVWLHQHIAHALSPGLEVPLTGPLQHAGALLVMDRDQQLWHPLVRFLLYDGLDRLKSLGRLDLVTAALNALSDWFGRIPVAKIEEIFWQREWWVLFNEGGQLATAQGNLLEAQRLFRKGLAIAEELVARDPAETEWQRDLSVSQDRIGNVLLAQGHGTGALAAYRQGLAIRETLAARDPANTQWQSDLSISHDRIANVLVEHGDGTGALAAYRQGRMIREKLAADDPANTQWQRDLSISQDRIGDVLVAQGDIAAALAAYRQGLAIREALVTRDPTNTQSQRNLSISHNRIGDVLIAQGDLPGSLAAYQKALTIAQALAARDPTNTEWQRDLSISHNNIGAVMVTQGDGTGALAAYRSGLAIAEALAARDPANTRWQRDLSISHNNTAAVMAAQGDEAGALTAHQRALSINATLAARDPANTEWQRDLSISQSNVGDVLVAQGDLAGALTMYRQGLAIAAVLATRDAANIEWQRDLSRSQHNVGDVLVAQNDVAGALAAYRQGFAIAAALAARDPANLQWQRDLSTSQNNMGNVLVAQGDEAGALAMYRQGLAIREALASQDPTNIQRLRDVSISQQNVGELLVAQGDEAGALVAYQRGLAICEALAQRDQTNIHWQCDLADSLGRLGTLTNAVSEDQRRHNLLRGYDILTRLRAGRRLPFNRDRIEWFEHQLAVMSGS